MLRKITIVAVLFAPLVSFSQMGQMAIWTGKMTPAISIAGNIGFNCEYDLFGKKFWILSTTLCEPSIFVQ